MGNQESINNRQQAQATEGSQAAQVRFKSFQGGNASNPSIRDLLFGSCCAKGDLYPTKLDLNMMDSQIFFGGQNKESTK